ncbi:hypothetical protein GCM10009114_30360 [Aliiglaciecola litoralis]|uniref:STAS/SEC14 domain-containing protein n=2 Tax=Aliiglaciecola litoralis TaxID=582857 RepID=A0ABN1LQ42_9ALTE
MSVDGQVLVIEGEGPATLDLVMTYQKNVQSYREQILPSPWVSLVLLRGTPLVTSESIDILTETIKQAKSMQLKATAVVLVDIQYAEIVQLFWQTIFDSAGIKYRFFESEKGAREWLNSIIASC